MYKTLNSEIAETQMNAQIGLRKFTVTAESLHMAGLRAVKQAQKLPPEWPRG